MNQATNDQIRIWREKAIAGTLSREELREAIQILREDRLACGAASAKSKAKSSKNINSDDLLKELEGL